MPLRKFTDRGEAARVLCEQLVHVAMATCDDPETVALAIGAASRMVNALVTRGLPPARLHEFHQQLAGLCVEVDRSIAEDDADENARRS